MDAPACGPESAAGSRSSQPVLILFLRAPEKGRVKTRLAGGIGPDAALQFYRICAEQTLATLEKSGFPIWVCFDPPDAEHQVVSWLGNRHPIFPQRPGDLGLRMADAFTRAFQAGFSRALLVGADIPGLTALLLRDAVLSLDHHPAAVGPALDGGYYLIAFRSDAFRPVVFSEIAWGTERVFRQTLGHFRAQGLSCHHLPPLGDIDTAEDLLHFAHNSHDDSPVFRWANESIRESID